MLEFKETIDNAHRNCPVLYVLIKTHKMTEEFIKSNDASKFGCYPIIFGCDGPTDRVSWLLMYILTPLLDFIPAFLKNTKQVLDNLNTIDKDILKSACFESFDVTSLHTNVDNQAAVSYVM